MDGERVVPETELVYQRDSSLRAIDTAVTAVEAESRRVALDRTVMFPGGGGQPSDVGHPDAVSRRKSMADRLGGQDNRRRLA